MSRKCDLTGTRPQFGNNVSHSQRKTRRSFEPNLRSVKYKSEITGREYRLKITAKCMRTIEQKGGFDQFVLDANTSIMSNSARSVKKDIMKQHNKKILA